MYSAPETAFNTTLHWLVGHGYALMFLAMVFEGPVVIMAASFAASMGYFNPGIVFALAALGDLTGDLIWFAAGYFGRVAFLSRFQHRFNASRERTRKLGQLINRHPGKTLVAIKLSPFVPIPGLVAVGASHLSPGKFAAIVSLIIIPKTVLFVALGYFFGYAYGTIALYLKGQIYAFFIILALALVFYLAYRRMTGRISARMEE